MKKLCLLIGLVALLATGCANNKTEKALKNLAILQMNHDTAKMKDVVMDLYKQDIIIKESSSFNVTKETSKAISNRYKLNTLGKSKCIIIRYSEAGQKKRYGYCK